jgi:tight adherence protein B
MSLVVMAALVVGCAVLLGLGPGRARLPLTALGHGDATLTFALVLASTAALSPWVLPWIGHLSALRLVVGLIVLGSAADLGRRWRRRRLLAVSVRRRGQVLGVCELIAADVRAGLPPGAALAAAAKQWPEFGVVARAAELGADIPTAMRALADLPGAGQVRVMAAAWQVAHRSGAGLASALDLAAATLRDEKATASVVATEVASARATASILALLPVGVLVLGSGVGGSPWSFLFDSAPGVVCLAIGIGLAHAGLAWLDVIADGVMR